MKFANLVFLSFILSNQVRAAGIRTQIFATKANDHYLEVYSCHPTEDEKAQGVGNAVFAKDCKGQYPDGDCKPIHPLVQYDLYQASFVQAELQREYAVPHISEDFVSDSRALSECPEDRACVSFENGIEFTVMPEAALQGRRDGFLFYYQLIEDGLKQKLIELNHPIADCGST